MTDTTAPEAHATSDHLKARMERGLIASVLARGATHDFVANGGLDRIWMTSDALCQSDALGTGQAFALACHFVQQLGNKDPDELPPLETWIAVCAKPYVAQFLGETKSRLGDKAPWLDQLLSGKLEFPYETMPPLSRDSFERSAEILRGNLEARLSERKVLAKLDGIELFQFIDTISLGREEDAKKVDEVQEFVRAAISRRRNGLIKAIATRLRRGKIADYHDPRAFTEIKLNDLFDDWWKDLSGDLLTIAIDNGSRGQSDKFVVPPYRNAILNGVEWSEPPYWLTRSSMGHGVRYTGLGTGVGAAGGGAVSGAKAYATGMLTMAKYPAALKLLGAGALVGGAGLGVAVGLAWLGLKYWQESATAEYEVYVRDLVDKRDCQEFRVRAAIVDPMEVPDGTTQSTPYP